MTYLSDDHTHSRISPDARYSMTEMAEAAVRAGLQELCFTDHKSPVGFRGTEPAPSCDWDAMEREFCEARAALDGRLTLHLGAEFGDAPLDFAHSEELLRPAHLDFVIGSIHRLSARYNREDLYDVAADNPADARAQIADYLELLLALARWGKFSVLGHMTLPVRYMNENRGLHMTFDGFEAEMETVFRALLENGCGIEVNTNRGHDALPGAKWLRMYRSLGGEIVTLGSDAHTPGFVGCAMRENQRLLRECGFTRFCTFEKLRPVWHSL